MPARNYRNSLVWFSVFKILKNVGFLTKLVKWRFVFPQNQLILPLFIQLVVLIRIGFTKEFVFALFQALTSELECLDRPVFYIKQPLPSQFNSESDDNVNDISNENTNTEEIGEYPKGDSCKICKKKYETTLNWCTECDIRRLQDNFQSSGHEELDKIIRKSQLSAESHTNYIEWIPYEKFKDIKMISEGGFGIVFSATWVEGPKWKWDDEKMQWVSSGPRKIALKTLKCDSITKRHEEFFKEVEYHAICVGINRIVHCFGVTRNPDTGKYMLVTNFANEGDLASYTKKHQKELTWESILRLSRDIAKALRELHRKGLIHCDLHSGNILNHVTCYGITWTWIADLGLCLKDDESQTRNQVYGRLEYIAPEVHCHKLYSKAADVYSFGMILWELTSCRTPFSDVTRDSISLHFEITGGTRPNIVEGTPPAFAKLMQDCWNEDPNLRPNMEDVYKRIWSFSNSIIKGNRKDKYGFRAARNDRSINTPKQTPPKFIHSPDISGYLSYKIIIHTPIPSVIKSGNMNSCRIKNSINKESKATENQKSTFKVNSGYGVEKFTFL
ncbi:hypothetical protein RclHR1_01300021 [Rhizophagus clarus]|uniref:Kinase-like domain-containing protein n=1 Tax=Rhizophagus clarus TaxID=94130 RepID=A0A2Z6R1P6_9GLOM|nr:hypothetical protein RclHR1_01300021 [Rhizophagus clarus]GES95704.1 kinase-like domain-containing protein [Rhizophagus clarus]